MSDERCRACGATVPEQAQWCSLCFSDLRTPPAAVREPAVVAAAATVSGSGQSLDAAMAGADGTSPTPEPSDVQSFVAAVPPAPPRPTDTASWPCPHCRAWVAMSLDSCPDCGAGFLSGATETVGTRLPLVGDMSTFSAGQRLLIGAGISIVLMVIFVVLAEVGGHLF